MESRPLPGRVLACSFSDKRRCAGLAFRQASLQLKPVAGTLRWSLSVLDGCARHGISFVGLVAKSLAASAWENLTCDWGTSGFSVDQASAHHFSPSAQANLGSVGGLAGCAGARPFSRSGRCCWPRRRCLRFLPRNLRDGRKVPGVFPRAFYSGGERGGGR